MAARVDPVTGDSGWYSEKPPDQKRSRKGQKPSDRPSESEESVPAADDYYTPSEPGEEG
jgi:hypothetical protein